MKTSLNALHHQENDWLRELDFYAIEVDLLEKRLKEAEPLLEGNYKLKMGDFISKFQNIKQQCEDLKKENTERSERLAQIIKVLPNDIEKVFTAEEDNMIARVENLTSIFRKTRSNLALFIATGK